MNLCTSIYPINYFDEIMRKKNLDQVLPQDVGAAADLRLQTDESVVRAADGFGRLCPGYDLRLEPRDLLRQRAQLVLDRHERHDDEDQEEPGEGQQPGEGRAEAPALGLVLGEHPPGQVFFDLADRRILFAHLASWR